MHEPGTKNAANVAAIISGACLAALSLLPAWYAGWVSANWASDDLTTWYRILPITDNLIDYLGSFALSLLLGIAAIAAYRGLSGRTVKSTWLLAGAIPAVWVLSLLLVDLLQVTVSAPLPSRAKSWFAASAGVLLLAAIVCVVFTRSRRENSHRTSIIAVGASLALMAFTAASAFYQVGM
ncbi:hypothetical protein [Nonomuraea sp. NPDC050691]|uniref:hypothetical protein n=1 Tax=Nonomuraea sp. NPDC050691 TaxID=3155661 RepID=UPI0033C5DFC6